MKDACFFVAVIPYLYLIIVKYNRSWGLGNILDVTIFCCVSYRLGIFL